MDEIIEDDIRRQAFGQVGARVVENVRKRIVDIEPDDLEPLAAVLGDSANLVLTAAVLLEDGYPLRQFPAVGFPHP